MASRTPSPLLPTTMFGMEIADKQLRRVELPLPSLRAGEVLIRVAYAGINHADMLQRDGSYPAPEGASPLPGMEVSGTIAAIGAAVTDLAIGDEVCALMGGGGYAEYAAAPSAQTLLVPSKLTLAEAATLPEAAATAVMALWLEAELDKGERVLLHGGTSGIGLIMAQVAKAWGAEVYATVGSDEKVAWLSGFGIQAINHRRAPYAEQVMALTNNEGVDVVIDTLGAPQVEAHFKLLRRGGRMVSLAMLEGNKVESLKIGRLLTHRLRWSGTTLRSRTAAEKAEIMQLVQTHLWPQLSAGRIRPAIAAIFPLAEAEKALASMQERLHLGKILLEGTSN